MTWATRTIQLHLATCRACETTFQDTNPDRLGAEMDRHETECPAKYRRAR